MAGLDSLVKLCDDSMSGELVSWSATLKRINTDINKLTMPIPSEAIINLKTPSCYHHHLKVQLVNHFRLTEVAYRMLQSDDRRDSASVINLPWLFESTPCDPSTLVNQVFPEMSYCVRLKVVSKFSRKLQNQSLAEALVKAVSDRYGPALGLQLLPACDMDFIQNTLHNIKYPVSSKLLYKLYLKYPNVVIDFLKDVLTAQANSTKKFQQIKIHEYDMIFKAISLSNPKAYVQLLKKYSTSHPYLQNIQLSRRGSRRVLKAGASEICQNPKDFVEAVQPSQLVSVLKIGRAKEIFVRLLPKSIEQLKEYSGINQNFLKILTAYKKLPVREKLMYDSFTEAYGVRPEDVSYDYLLTSLVSEHMPAFVLEQWAQKNMLDKPKLAQAEYYKYLHPSKALPLLKQHLKLCLDEDSRLTNVKSMFSSARLHQDMHAVAELMKYVVERLRNDQTLVRKSVITELSKFKSITISPTDWDPLFEFVKIFELNKELEKVPLDEIYTVLSQMIDCWVDAGRDVTEVIQILWNSTSWQADSLQHFKNKKHEHLILTYYMPKLKKKYHNNKKVDVDWWDLSAGANTLKAILDWNKRHPEQKLPVEDWILILVEERLHKNHYETDVAIGELKPDPELKERLLSKNFPACIAPQIVKSKLASNPKEVFDNLHSILEILYENNYYSHHLVRMLVRYPQMSKVIKEYAFDVINERKEGSSGTAIEMLFSVLEPEELIEFVTPYFPSDSKITDYSEQGNQLNWLRGNVAHELKRFSNSEVAVPAIKAFAQGDFLRYVVTSMRSIFVNMKERKALATLAGWLDSPVSLRKLIVRLHCLIAPVQGKVDFLLGLVQNEKNVSLKNVYLSLILNQFQSSQDPVVWRALMEVVNLLGEEDITFINTILSFRQLPDYLVSDFVYNMWSLVNRLNIGDKYTNKLISYVTDWHVINLLANGFCDSLFDCVQGKFRTSNFCKWTDFAALYALSSDSEETLMTRQDKLVTLIKALYHSSIDWNDIEKDIFPVSGIVGIYILVDSVGSMCLSVDEASIKTKNLMLSNIIEVLRGLDPHSFLAHILQLRIVADALLIQKNNPESFSLFVNKFGQLIEEFVQVYNLGIIQFFTNIDFALCQHASCDELQSRKIDLCKSLLTEFNSTACHVVAIELLQTIYVLPCNLKENKQLISLIQMLPALTNPVEKVFVNKYFYTQRT